MTNTTEAFPVPELSFRFWYIPQIPMKAYEREFKTLEEAKTALDMVIEFSTFEFENNVKGAYSDAGGVSEFNPFDGEWDDVEE